MPVSKKRKPKAKSRKTPAATKRAIRIKADVNLFDAIMKDNIAAVRILLDAGADVHAKDKYGNTALMEAEETGHGDIVVLLNEHIMHAELPEARGPSGGKVDSPGI